jgi:hypothetical protein
MRSKDLWCRPPVMRDHSKSVQRFSEKPLSIKELKRDDDSPFLPGDQPTHPCERSEVMVSVAE